MVEPKIVDQLRKLSELAVENKIEELKVGLTNALIYRYGKWTEEPVSAEVFGYYDPSYNQKARTFSQEVGSLLESAKIEAALELEPKIVGHKFTPVGDALPILAPEQGPADIIANVGQITIIVLWATGSKESMEAMKGYIEMVGKHAEWGPGKVRLVFINADEGPEAAAKAVKEHGFTKVEQYWEPGGIESELGLRFKVKALPYTILVNIHGGVEKAGPFKPEAIEGLIGTVIKTRCESCEERKEGMMDKTYTYEKCKQELMDFVAGNQAEINLIKQPLFAVVFKRVGTADGIVEPEDAYVLARYEWSTKNKDEAQKLKQKLLEKFLKKVRVKIQDIENRMYSIKFGTNCKKCNCALGEVDQYFCELCTPKAWFCVNCITAATHPEPQSIADLPHPHGLYFIQKGSKAFVLLLANKIS